MRERKCQKNIQAVKEEVAGLQTNTNEAMQKAKQGFFKLKQMREEVPEEYFVRTAHLGAAEANDRMNLCMLNDYLNGYTNKLSRANPKDPTEIRIDQQQFGAIDQSINKKTYAPYAHYREEIKIARRINKQLLKSENPRYMTQELKQQLAIKDEIEV